MRARTTAGLATTFLLLASLHPLPVAAQLTTAWHAAATVWAGEPGSLSAVTSGHGRFVAVGARDDSSGVVVTSPDGQTWQEVSGAATAPLSTVASGPSGFLALGRDGAAATSPDGWSWTPGHIAALEGCTPHGLVWTGSTYVAVGAASSADPFNPFHGCSAVSQDGQSWQTTQLEPELEDVVSTDAGLVALGGQLGYHDVTAAVLTSPDGLTWTATARPALGSATLASLAWSGGQLAAVGELGDYTGRYGAASAASPDARTWRSRTLLTTEDRAPFAAVVWAGHCFLGYGNGVFSSLDGLHWAAEATEVDGQPLPACGKLAVSGSRVAAIGRAAAGGAWTATLVPPQRLEAADQQELVVPTAAHASGLHGSLWTTDLVLVNHGSERANATLYLLPAAGPSPAAAFLRASVPPAGMVDLGDVVGTGFLAQGAAGAVVIVTDRPLAVSSRTSSSGSTGSFGQHVGAVAADSGLGQGQEGRLIQLTRSSLFRTNLGLVSLAGVPTDVEVELRSSDGEPLGSRVYALRPYGFFQETDIFAKLGVMEAQDAYAVVRPTSPGARVLAYASVIDNRSNDPELVVPLPIAAGEPLYLPAAAHSSGYNGTVWRTDLELHNPGEEPATVSVEALPAGRDNTTTTSRTYTLGPGTCRRLPDVLAQTFGAQGVAALRVTAVTGRVAAIARTYDETAAGTLGQSIAGVPAAAGLPPEDGFVVVGLSQSGDPSRGFRTNVGFLNLDSAPLEVEVSFWNDDTRTSSEVRVVEVPPLGTIQLSQPVLQEFQGGLPAGWAVVRPRRSGARLLAYASVIDNRSGDPIYIPGQ
jgi:hypothetical protein